MKTFHVEHQRLDGLWRIWWLDGWRVLERCLMTKKAAEEWMDQLDSLTWKIAPSTPTSKRANVATTNVATTKLMSIDDMRR